MHDAVVLYARSRYLLAKEAVAWLESNGLAVWWDRKQAYGQWARNVEEALRNTRCAAFIWPSSAQLLTSELSNEMQYAKARHVPCFHFVADMHDKPLEISAEVTEELRTTDQLGNLRRIISWITSKKTDGMVRATKPVLAIENSISCPCFVRSVSSHETQLPPLSALLALTLHPDRAPILFSAFDWYHLVTEQKDQARQYIERLRCEGVTVMLDSGNYEAFRTKAWHAQLGRTPPSGAWTKEKFFKAISDCGFADVVFTYDDPAISGDAESCVRHIEAEYQSTKNNCNPSQLVIPIVHAPYDDRGHRQIFLLPEVISRAMQVTQCSYVAVAERELGDGIQNRCRAVREIKTQMKEAVSYPRLHLLGTGNPLSITLLAAAGADSFDGLEWLRVISDPAGVTLHHFQHFDLFREHMKFSEFDIVREVASDPGYSYALKAAVHNLDFLHMWLGEVRRSLASNSVEQLLAAYGRQESASCLMDALYPNGQ